MINDGLKKFPSGLWSIRGAYCSRYTAYSWLDLSIAYQECSMHPMGVRARLSHTRSSLCGSVCHKHMRTLMRTRTG